jgi:hypothetical protein
MVGGSGATMGGGIGACAPAPGCCAAAAAGIRKANVAASTNRRICVMSYLPLLIV